MQQELSRGLFAIYVVFLYFCMPGHSQGFKGYCETKRTIPVIPIEKLADTKRTFYAVAHSQGVIGAIDCTHIRIIRPNNENAIGIS